MARHEFPDGSTRVYSYGPFGMPGLRTCPTCKGTGINPLLPSNVCPKCKGETKVWS